MTISYIHLMYSWLLCPPTSLVYSHPQQPPPSSLGPFPRPMSFGFCFVVLFDLSRATLFSHEIGTIHWSLVESSGSANGGQWRPFSQYLPLIIFWVCGLVMIRTLTLLCKAPRPPSSWTPLSASHFLPLWLFAFCFFAFGYVCISFKENRTWFVLQLAYSCRLLSARLAHCSIL